MEQRKLKDLTPDAKNANRGSERGQQMIEDSLRQFGAGRSILIDRHGNVIGGNKTLESAAAIGLDDVIVVQTDGTKLVAVQRTDIDLDSKAGRELAIADNRAAQVSLNWDTNVLKELTETENPVELEKFWTSTELEFLFPTDSKDETKSKNMQQDDDLRYQIVVECGSELDQTAMLDRFEREGIKCKALIS